MGPSNTDLRKTSSVVQRYGLALLSVAIALGTALFLASQNFQGVEFPLFLVAISLTVWYLGTGPAILALLLSSLAFNYYFTEPRYTFYVTRSDLPYYAMFILFPDQMSLTSRTKIVSW